MNKQHINETAIEMVKESGLINLTRRELCERANIPDGSFPNIMGCTFTDFIAQLKKQIPDDAGTHIVYRGRVDPAMRKAQILFHAAELAKEIGYHNMSRENIAEAAGVSVGLITKYFGNMVKLRRAVIRYAINRQIPEIIAQGIINKDRFASKAPDDLKEKAAKIIINI